MNSIKQYAIIGIISKWGANTIKGITLPSGWLHLSQRDISRLCDIGQTSVSYIISTMCRDGMISRSALHFGTKQKCTIYSINNCNALELDGYTNNGQILALHTTRNHQNNTHNYAIFSVQKPSSNGISNNDETVRVNCSETCSASETVSTNIDNGLDKSSEENLVGKPFGKTGNSFIYYKSNSSRTTTTVTNNNNTNIKECSQKGTNTKDNNSDSDIAESAHGCEAGAQQEDASKSNSEGSQDSSEYNSEEDSVVPTDDSPILPAQETPNTHAVSPLTPPTAQVCGGRACARLAEYKGMYVDRNDLLNNADGAVYNTVKALLVANGIEVVENRDNVIKPILLKDIIKEITSELNMIA